MRSISSTFGEYWLLHRIASALVLLCVCIEACPVWGFSFISGGRKANPDFGTVGPQFIPTEYNWNVPTVPAAPFPIRTLNITFNTAPAFAVPVADQGALARAVATWTADCPVAANNYSIPARLPVGTPVKVLGGQNYDVESIFLHELGHAFGLDHPNHGDRPVGAAQIRAAVAPERYTASTLGPNAAFNNGSIDGVIGNFNDASGDDLSLHLVDSDNNPFNLLNGSIDKSNFSMDGPFTTGGFAQTSTREVSAAGAGATGFAAIAKLEAVMVQGTLKTKFNALWLLTTCTDCDIWRLARIKDFSVRQIILPSASRSMPSAWPRPARRFPAARKF